ncbi:MAG: hypothetical protein WCG80_04510 [Spirochaetales bacterium]
MKASTRLLLWGVAASLGLTALIAALQPLLAPFQALLLPDQGPAWYYWKLPQPELWARVSAWSLYALHQVALWGVIGYALKHPQTFGENLSKPGWWALIVNIVFWLLHLAQTALFYDGTAQDVPVWSSQFSVILMLILILILLNDRRGLFFGKKVPMPAKPVAWLKKYHGFIISFGLVYTFWFHPMEGTWGHLAGFFYMALLFLQSVFIQNRNHVNPKWVFFLEASVLVHGTTIALQAGQTLWPMFAFGFGFMAIFTQMYGFKWPKWVNISLTVLYFAAVAAVYSGFLWSGGQWKNIHQIVWIPTILYLMVPVVLALAAGAAWIGDRFARKESA